MMEIARAGVVLAAVDGSVVSKAALSFAADVAERSGRAVRVVLVREHPATRREIASAPVWPFPVVERVDPGALAEAEQSLAKFADSVLAERPVLVDKVVVRDGDASAEILSEGNEHQAALIVLGRRGLGGFSSLLLGSVSDQCATHASIPVLVVGHVGSDRGGPIVVGVDGSAHSLRAVEWAAEQALVFGVRVQLIAAWEAPVFMQASTGLSDEPIADLYGADAAEHARAAAEHVRTLRPSVEVSVTVERGHPSEVLVRSAVRSSALMLAVGSRGRGTFASVVLGSVARQCLHHAATPIAVVH